MGYKLVRNTDQLIPGQALSIPGAKVGGAGGGTRRGGICWTKTGPSFRRIPGKCAADSWNIPRQGCVIPGGWFGELQGLRAVMGSNGGSRIDIAAKVGLNEGLNTPAPPFPYISYVNGVGFLGDSRTTAARQRPSFLLPRRSLGFRSILVGTVDQDPVSSPLSHGIESGLGVLDDRIEEQGVAVLVG